MKDQNINLIEELLELLCIHYYADKIHEIQAKEYIYDFLTQGYYNPQLYKTYLQELQEWEKLNKEILQNQETNRKAREYAYHFIDQYPDIPTETSVLEEAYLAGYNEARKKYTIQNEEDN